jgi:hypothetical protein
VKTNARPAKFWLLSEKAAELRSKSHVYVFVNLRGDLRPDYWVVSSETVATKMRDSSKEEGKKAGWFSFWSEDAPDSSEGWALFDASSSND